MRFSHLLQCRMRNIYERVLVTGDSPSRKRCLVMHRQHRFNQLLLLWLLMAIGFVLPPAKGFASCDMHASNKSASGHDCCAQGAACNCAMPLQNAAPGAPRPINLHAGCSCEMEPEPASSREAETQSIRLCFTAGLPVRAAPDFSACAQRALRSLPLISVPCSFYILRSPSRAPPF